MSRVERRPARRCPGAPRLVSDVVDLSLNAVGPDDATSVFALEVSYQNLGANEGLLASKGLIYLAWLNPVGYDGTTPLWVNAVNGNNGHGTTVDTDVLSSYDRLCRRQQHHGCEPWQLPRLVGR